MLEPVLNKKERFDIILPLIWEKFKN